MTSPQRHDGRATNQHGLSGFLDALFELLEREQVRYGVLHSREDRGDLDLDDLDLGDLLETGRDLDLLVDPRDAARLQSVVRQLSDAGYAPIQAMNYEVNAWAHVFAWFDRTKLRTVVVDFAFEHRERSFRWKPGAWKPGAWKPGAWKPGAWRPESDMLSGRQRRGNFWTVSAATEFRDLLLKEAAQRSVREDRAGRLRLLIGDMGQDRAEQITGEIFGRKWGHDIVEASLAGRFGEMVPGLWRVLRWRRLLLRPWNALWCAAQDGLRRTRRWLQPTGLCIMLLGPDGVGKSTLMEGLREAFGPVFRRQRQYHWRPGLALPIRDGDDPVGSPHAQPARSPLVSVCYLLGFFADFCLGYALRVRPILARSGLIFFDRYFPDMMVDRKRYRYSGPAWLVKALWAMLPGRDDLVLVLSGDERAILARKQQLPAEEIRRQLAKYRELGATMPNAYIVETDGGIERTLADGSAIVLLHLARRFQDRHSLMQGETSIYAAEGRL